MSDEDSKFDPGRVGAGRGPAYPYVPLGKAVERAEQLRNANMARLAASPLAIYKVWGWSGDNGNARQTMAALNHFGLVEYVGRGDQRQAKLSPLALRIVFDKVPDSKERVSALREAALMPPIYQRLWQQYKGELPPDVVIETFLTRDCGYNEGAARNVIGGYRDTLEFSGLDKPDIIPPEPPQIQEGSPMLHEPPPAPVVAQVAPASVTQFALPVASGENDIKVLLDGASLRVSAVVDAKGAKKLIKVLQANLALIEADDEQAN